MQTIVSIVLLVLTSPLAFSQSVALQVERVWLWSGACAHATMQLELLVEGQAVYHTRFRACRMERTDSTQNEQQKIRVFHFLGGHIFQGRYQTTKRERIEGNIWQAGADLDAMLLGVSFTAPGAHGQILLNTIHIAKPCIPSQSTLDRGVVIKTYPVSKASAQFNSEIANSKISKWN
jgi:hypothetical protein